MPTSLYLLLRSSSVQTYLTHKITQYVSNKYHVKIDIEGVDIGLFDKVILEKLYVEDNRGDTMIFVDELKVVVNKFKYSTNYINANKITLSHAYLNLFSNENDVLNLQQFINKFSSTEEEDTTSATWNIECHKFDLENIRFAYRTFKPDSVEHGMNFSDLYLDSINGQIAQLNIGDTISLKINQLSLLEKSGFRLDSTKAGVGVSNKGILLDTLMLKTPYTKLISNNFGFNFDSFDDFSDFIKKIDMKVDILDSSYLSSIDLAYFVPDIWGLNQTVRLTGNITGTINSLKAKNLFIAYGKSTSLLTNFDISGLPDIEQTFMFIDIEQLAVNPIDLKNFKLPPFNENNYLELPDMLNGVGTMFYEASFYGLVTDFVVDGELNSTVGKIKTDLRLYPDKNREGKLNFSGNLITQNFRLNPFLKEQGIKGELSMNFNVEGSQTKNGHVSAKLEGEFYDMAINKYKIQKLLLNGDLNNKKFDGSVEVVDNQLSMTLVGLFDFTNELPQIIVDGELRNLNLYRLELVKVDTTANLGFVISANMQGNDINNVTGFAELTDARIKKEGKELKLGKMNLTIQDLSSTEKEISFDSDVVDLSVTGSYNYETLISSINNLIYRYLPSLRETKEEKTKQHISNDNNDFNNFSIEVTLKNTKPLFETIPVNIKIKEGTHLLANYNANDENYSLKLESEEVNYDGYIVENLVLFSRNMMQRMETKLQCDKIFITDSRYIGSFEINSNVYRDTIEFNVDWNNHKPFKNYKGSLRTVTNIYRPTNEDGNSNSNRLLTDIHIKPTKLMLSDTIWQLEPSIIHIDTSYIRVNNFNIAYNDQSFGFEGEISKSSTDTTYINLDNINLEYLNLITEKKGFVFGGRLSGNFSFSNIYDTLVFYTETKINSLVINNDDFGNTLLNAEWNDALQKLHIKSTTGLRHINNLFAEGDYYPGTGVLDFDSIALHHLPLRIFQPFVGDYISNLQGRGHGSLKLKGTIENPELTGNLWLQKTTFLFDYLQTRYNLGRTDIRITPSAIFIDSTAINSLRTGRAYTSVELKHNNYANFRYKVKMDVENFCLMNTNEFQNEYFYGDAFASGAIIIEGNEQDVSIDATVKSEPNTQISIPLSYSGEVSEANDFIKFVKVNDEETTEVNEDYEVDLSGIEMNFNLQVTPDARLQLIFDKKVGDIIEASGNGNIRMLINSQGDFNIYGDYTIEDGEYLFTLKNIINKKLSVKQGGTLKWNGDPYNAQIDITAVYRANKVPIYDLMLDESMRDVYVPVECNLMMSESLTNPNINFSIKLPSEREMNSTLTTQLQSLPEDELNKQILSLLIINRFQPLPGHVQSGMNLESGLSTNAYEVLSNQLNHWLSQISKDFDVGVNYTPGSSLSNSQMEMMFKTQLFNNRVTINTNFGVTNFAGDAATNAAKSRTNNNVVGDFEMNYKITKNGKLRAKYFAKTNDDQLDYDSYYMQGVGIMYKHEFDLDYSEVIRAFFEKIDK